MKTKSEQIPQIILSALKVFGGDLWETPSLALGTIYLASRMGLKGTRGSGRFLFAILSWILIGGPWLPSEHWCLTAHMNLHFYERP